MSNDNILKLDPKRTALVTIDLQKGLLALPLTPHGAADIVARNLALGQKLRLAGGLIVAIRVAFGADYSDRPQGLTDVPMILPPGGLPADWADPAPELSSLVPDLAITKRQWSAFFGTELDLQLRRRGITTILLSGIATNFGVESTARDGWQTNYDMIVVEDGSSSYGEGLHDFAVRNTLPRVSRVRRSDEIMRLI